MYLCIYVFLVIFSFCCLFVCFILVWGVVFEFCLFFLREKKIMEVGGWGGGKGLGIWERGNHDQNT